MISDQIIASRDQLNRGNVIIRRSMNTKTEAPSLLDLCVRTAIDNVRYLGDVGETDIDLLDRILPHCSIEQLMCVEKNTVGRDLSQVTDKLWKRFYTQKFGSDNADLVVKRMSRNNISHKWIDLYKAKEVDVEQALDESADRLKQRYKDEDARKKRRTIQMCSKVPPSSNKRSFYGGSGAGNLSNVKGNLMKKAKLEFLNSREMKNIAAARKAALQQNHRMQPHMKFGRRC